jgi:dTDP-glucose 4,6-dehydratase
VVTNLRLLVTGGAGFIGSNFVRRQILRESHWTTVTVLDNLTYAGNLDNLEACVGDSRFKFVKGNILDQELVTEVLSDVDVVVHFAAESHVDRSIQNPRLFVETNVLGTHSLLESALRARVQTFIHVSTDEVYGSITSGSWPETHPISPNSPYSASKAGSDLLAISYFRTFGMDVRVTRCSNNYGPFQHPEKLIPLFITNLLEDRKVPLFGEGLNIRDWLHVDDHCNAIELVISRGKPGEIYNIGGGKELTNLEITRTILAHMNKGDEFIENVEDRKGHDFRYSVSTLKIETFLGYTPKVDFESGIADTINWYEKNPLWWKFKKV